MPPTIIDLRKTEDPRDVVHLTVQALAESRAVIVPTETDYVVAVAVRGCGVGEVLKLAVPRNREPLLSLSLKSEDEAIAWAPRLDGVAGSIARR